MKVKLSLKVTCKLMVQPLPLTQLLFLVNDPIYHVGDVTSNRTVTIPVVAGVSTINLDSVVGINTGDHIAATGIAVGGIGTVTAIDIANKTVTYNGTSHVLPGITTTSQVVITHGYDTNTDRGISFNYNISSGVANNKTGFFGFDDSELSNSSVTATNHGTHGDGSRKWTYIPDATVSNSVVTGTKGFLDVKGIYYQSGNFNTGGAVYFDSDGLQRSTNSPSDAGNTLTSTQILTAVSEIVLTVSSSSYTQGAQITQQNNSSAYGVVKTTVNSGTAVTLIGVQGTFNTTDDLVVNGASNSITPSNVATTYTNKPTWTDTIDGGTFHFMNKEVDVNILIKNYHAKISSLMNQNILLEAKLESLTQDYLELQQQVQTEDFQEPGIE